MKKTFLKLLTVVIVVCATLFTLTACEKECSHSESDWFVKTQATCIEKGLSQKKCLSCEKVLEEKVLEIASHTESDWIIDDNSTCETGGLKHKECIICDAVLQVETIAKGAHTESDWITINDSTCQNVGLKHKKCIICEQIIDVSLISIKEHNAVWAIEKDCTTIEFGKYNKSCTTCGTILESIETSPLEYTLNEDEKSYSVSSSDYKEFTHCVIQPTYNGMPVTKIENGAFEYNDLLFSVFIPDSVIEIGESAFEGCDNITSIIIPDGVEEIEDSTFMGCSNLQEIKIPNSVVTIGDNAFYGCDSLQNFEISANVTSIGVCAFSTTIKVNENNTVYKSIDGSLYSKNEETLFICTQQSTTFAVPESVINIAEKAFYCCSNLQTVNFAQNCKLESISYRAFYMCSIQRIEIPSSIISIGESAFAYCHNLQTVTFDKDSKLERIEDFAFASCDLQSVAIPDKVIYIGNGALNAKNITIGENNTAFKVDDGNLYSKDGKTLVIYSKGQTATSFTIPENVTSIAGGAFSGCTLESIEINANIKDIKDYTFSGCKNLKTVSFAQNSQLKSIGEYAFSGCISLENIIIPNSVEGIGSLAFADCRSLQSIFIPNSVVNIGKATFTEGDTRIYCEVESQPAGWENGWSMYGDYNVVWGYKGEN